MIDIDRQIKIDHLCNWLAIKALANNNYKIDVEFLSNEEAEYVMQRIRTLLHRIDPSKIKRTGE